MLFLQNLGQAWGHIAAVSAPSPCSVLEVRKYLLPLDGMETIYFPVYILLEDNTIGEKDVPVEWQNVWTTCRVQIDYCIVYSKQNATTAKARKQNKQLSFVFMLSIVLFTHF